MPRSSGRRDKALEIFRPVGPAVSDGDGEYERSYSSFVKGFGSIETASARSLERYTISGAVVSATHIWTIPFVKGIAVGQRIRYNGRLMNILGYADPDESHVELILFCQELLNAPPLQLGVDGGDPDDVFTGAGFDGGGV